MFLGFDALTLVLGGTVGILIGAAIVLLVTNRCICKGPNHE